MKQALGEVVRSWRAPIVSQVEMRTLLQVKAGADKIVKPVLSNTRFLVLKAVSVRKRVDRAVDEFHQRDLEWALTTVAEDEQSIQHFPL